MSKPTKEETSPEDPAHWTALGLSHMVAVIQAALVRLMRLGYLKGSYTVHPDGKVDHKPG